MKKFVFEFVFLVAISLTGCSGVAQEAGIGVGGTGGAVGASSAGAAGGATSAGAAGGTLGVSNTSAAAGASMAAAGAAAPQQQNVQDPGNEAGVRETHGAVNASDCDVMASNFKKEGRNVKLVERKKNDLGTGGVLNWICIFEGADAAVGHFTPQQQPKGESE